MDMDLQSLQLLTSILIFTISGVLSHGLQVTLDPELTYSGRSICGLKGWSLAVTCSFSPPTNQTISSVFWFTSKERHQWRSEDQPEDLLLDANYMGRVTYSEGTEGSSELTITDLRLGDSGVYHCLYVSNEGRYSDSTGVNITVTDLQIKAVGQNSVVVSCNTLCTLEIKTLKVPDEVKYFYFNIFKNGQYKSHSFLNGPAIHLNKDDGGSYTCTVGGLEHLPSPAVCVLSDSCWSVKYPETRICALVGSSVEMSSSYRYPKGLTVTNTTWHDKERKTYWKPVGNHSKLVIPAVQKGDAGEYQFRIVADTGFSGQPGVFLKVTGLWVRMSADNVSEGQNVTLTCSTSCSLSYNPSFVWYKNGHPVAHRHVRKSNKLYLITLNARDSGHYSCAVEKGNFTSPTVTLSIRASGLAHYSAGGDHMAVYVTAGIIALLMVLLLCGALWMRKRRRSTSPERTDRTAGGDKVMAPPVSSHKSPQAVDTVDDNDDEVQYSSLHFGRKQNNKHQQRQGEDSDVVYASVKPHQHHRSSQAGDAADDVQYSSLEFGQRNKQNNKHQQHEREDPDVLYASVRVS